MKQLDDYFKLQKEIYDYFGYVEDWVVIPIEDRRDMYWQLNQNANGSGRVVFHDDPLTNDAVADGAHYSDEIYTQCFLKNGCIVARITL